MAEQEIMTVFGINSWQLIAILVNVGCIVIFVFVIAYWIFAPILSAPYLATSVKDMLVMFSLADLGPSDHVVDLGSGDGRITLTASRVAASAVGVDHNPFLTLLSRFIAVLSPNGEVKFKNKSYMNENLSGYDVVFLYLMSADLKKLKDKFHSELAPGSRVVSNSFRIPGWRPIVTRKQGKKNIYLYVIGKSDV